MPTPKVTHLSFEAIALFQESLLARGRADHTVKAYTTDLRMILEFFKVDSITIENLERLAQQWLNRTRAKAAPKTTQRRLTSLRAFAQHAGLDEFLADYIAPTPARTIPHPINEGIPGVEKLVGRARQNHQRALVALTGLVGLRVSEALAVELADIDVPNLLLTVRGKGDKTRVVPIGRKAWDILAERYTECILSGTTRMVDYSDRGARRFITSLGLKCDIDLASHDLRATFATAALNRSKDIRAVQELLGHGSVTTTQIYTLATVDAMREAADL